MTAQASTSLEPLQPQKQIHANGEQSSARQDAASTSGLYQKPLPNFATSEYDPRRASVDSARSEALTSAETPQLQTTQEEGVTALSSVVLPALEAALHRRSYQLSLEQKKFNARADRNAMGGAQAEQDMVLKRQTHEQIRKCVGKVSRLFKEIDHWDNVAPVGMGDGVEGLLEGFLEEVLCRVEAEDA